VVHIPPERKPSNVFNKWSFSNTVDNTRQLIEVHQAQDTQDLLDHLAWTDVVLPKIRKAREQYTNVLVAMTLGATSPLPLTREQVAGRINGLDFVVELMQKILKRGKDAEEYLASLGISV
jgi:hypothetical protein